MSARNNNINNNNNNSNNMNNSNQNNNQESRLPSATLKRNPKLELSRADLLRLLSILEGELQAREIVIAVLKAESVKKLLHQNYKPNDPLNALARDAINTTNDTHFDEKGTKAAYLITMKELDKMIVTQRAVRNFLKEKLKQSSNNHQLMPNNNNDINNYNEKNQDKSEIERLKQELAGEKEREKAMVTCLLAERKALIVKLIEEKGRADELAILLEKERAKVNDMVSGVEEESNRSLQMEAELERQLSEFDKEKEKMKQKLEESNLRVTQLAIECDKLKEELEMKTKGVRAQIISSTCSPPIASICRSVESHSYATVSKATIPAPPSHHPPPPPPTTPPTTSSSVQTQLSTSTTTTTTPNTGGRIVENKTYMDNNNTTTTTSVVVTTAVVATATAVTTTTTAHTASTIINKGKSINKGTPPPIPPNKPSIRPVAPSTFLQQNKTKTATCTTTAPMTNTTTTTVPAPTTTHANNKQEEQVDVLCQEFHELYRSMVTNN